MEIGKLNRLVKIQRPVETQDALGQPIPGWTDVATVWANIAHKSGLEAIRADAPVSAVQSSIRIRYRADVDAGMRVLHGTRVYDIRAVMPDERGREFTDLVCTVGTNNG